jgi:hypothetical protein
MGYAVTNIGAQKLMFHLSLGPISNAVDIEIARMCVRRTIRCLEVNPPLIGLFRPGGSIIKDSDNFDKNDGMSDADRRKWKTARENPMGERSVKSIMEQILGPRLSDDW